MNNKIELNAIRIFFASMCAMWIFVGLVYLRTLLPNTPILNFIGYTCFAITIFIIFFNIIQYYRNKGKKLDIDIKEEYQKAINYKNDTNQYETKYKNLKKQIFQTNSYIIFLLLLQEMTIFCLITNGVVGALISILSLFLAIILFGFVFHITKPMIYLKDEAKKYPYLQKIIKKCVDKFNIKEKIITTFSFDDTISVTKDNHKTYLNIGVFILSLLAEEELENILYHEMAHIYNKDTLMSYQILKSSYLFYDIYKSSFLNFFNHILFFQFVNKTQEAIDLYLHFIQFEKEKKADAFVIQFGDKQQLINAIAKSSLFQYQDNYRFLFNVYELEQPTEHFIEYYNQKRIENYYEKQKMYDYFLSHALQRQFSTHPSLKTRMELLDVDTFSLQFDFTRDEEFQKEIEQINNNFNQKWLVFEKINWDKKREANYTFYVDIYNELKEKDFASLNLEDQLKLAYCNIILHHQDTARELYEKILEQEPNNSAALLNLALLKYSVNDFSCIEDFNKVKEANFNQAEFVSFYIGSMLNNNGKEDLIEEYRKSTLDDINQSIQNVKYSFAQKEKIFSNADLAKEDRQRILEKLKEYPFIQNAYILKRKINETEHCYILCVEYDPKKSVKEREEATDDLGVFVATFSDFVLYFDDSRSFKKIIKKNKIENILKKSH